MNTPNMIRFFEMLDSAAKLAFGILCLESLAYLGNLFYTNAEVAPLVSYVKPAFQNIGDAASRRGRHPDVPGLAEVPGNNLR